MFLKNSTSKRTLLYLAAIFVVALVLRVFFIETYVVDRHSMNNTLMDGDKILVSKVSSVKRGDVVVINHRGNMYIKRCVGLAGDKVVIEDGRIFVDSIEYVSPSSIVSFDETNMATRLMNKKGLVEKTVFTYYGKYWNLNNFGPYTIPKKGASIALDSFNRRLYRNILRDELKSNGLDERSLTGPAFTFGYDYVFLLGDNRPSSEDSRIFGAIRMDEVVGVAKLILYSTYNFSGRGFFKRIH